MTMAKTGGRKRPTHSDDAILSLAEVARQLGKSPQTVARWARDGLITMIRMPSNMPGVRQSEVNKFLGGSALNTSVHSKEE